MTVLRMGDGYLMKEHGDRFDKALIPASAMLLAFGIVAQILSERMGYLPLLTEYFLYLVPSVAVGFLAYFLMIKLRSCSNTGKVILTVFLILVFVWSAFYVVVCANMLFDERFKTETYGNGSYVAEADRKEEVQHMLSKCRLFGHGDAYYQYPEELIDPEQWIIKDLPQEVQNAIMERDRAKIFQRFRWDMLLPVLSYIYGYWITILFAVITAGWCICAVLSFRKLNLWWEKALYAVCGLLIAEQLIFPLLCGMGIAAVTLPHPFSLNWKVTLAILIPQLSVMFALVNPNGLNKKV